jgi:alkylation response protein AidB-like acyl-CoA dehydrogenase
MNFELTTKQRSLIGIARDLGLSFAERAAAYDRAAVFPTENFNDLRDAGLFKLCIPESYGGLGADYQTYMLVAAELGRYCGATTLAFNMHSCAMMWTGDVAQRFPLMPEQKAEVKRSRQLHFGRVVEEGMLYSQPVSENAEGWMQRPLGSTARRVEGGYIVSGTKIFASLSGAADYYGIICTELKDKPPAFEDTLYLALHKDNPGLKIVGEWDPLGMRATVSRTLVIKDAFIPESESLLPAGTYFMAFKVFPHTYMTLAPTYMGIAEAAYAFTIKYLRGEVDGTPLIRRRQYATKQLAVAEMYIKLQQARALFEKAISLAASSPPPDVLTTMFAAIYTVMEYSNEICRLAIRTCGGQSMLRSLPLERLYRDSRCGSLMLPFTAEICLDSIGKQALYHEGETDSDPITRVDVAAARRAAE